MVALERAARGRIDYTRAVRLIRFGWPFFPLVIAACQPAAAEAPAPDDRVALGHETARADRASRHEAHYRRAERAYARGHHTLAASELMALLRDAPRHRRAYRLLFDVWMARGRPEEAIAVAERGLRRLPGDAPLATRLADAFATRGEPEASLAVFERATRAAPADLALRWTYAQRLSRAGRIRRALAQARRLVREAEPGSEEALGARELIAGLEVFATSLDIPTLACDSRDALRRDLAGCPD